MLNRIWKQHGKRKPRPRLVLTKIAPSMYIYPDHLIRIYHGQMGHWFLIHEIVHALGYWEHDARFNRKCISLTAQYARMEEEPLLLTAQMMGLKVLG
jgi:hypothetical protein